MHQFSLNITFDAPLNKLFEAWHKPELLLQWLTPGDIQVTQVMASFTVGGHYRIQMQDSAYHQFRLSGQYLEIETDKRLVFTWQWEGSEQHTTVRLDFSEIRPGTSALTLTHQGFADEKSMRMHQEAWIACLEKLSLLTL